MTSAGRASFAHRERRNRKVMRGSQSTNPLWKAEPQTSHAQVRSTRRCRSSKKGQRSKSQTLRVTGALPNFGCAQWHRLTASDPCRTRESAALKSNRRLCWDVHPGLECACTESKAAMLVVQSFTSRLIQSSLFVTSHSCPGIEFFPYLQLSSSTRPIS